MIRRDAVKIKIRRNETFLKKIKSDTTKWKHFLFVFEKERLQLTILDLYPQPS